MILQQITLWTNIFQSRSLTDAKTKSPQCAFLLWFTILIQWKEQLWHAKSCLNGQSRDHIQLSWVTIWEPNRRLCAFTKQTKINRAWNGQITNTTTTGLTYTKEEMLWAATTCFGKELIKSTVLYWTLAYIFWFLSSFNLLLLATVTSYFISYTALSSWPRGQTLAVLFTWSSQGCTLSSVCETVIFTRLLT